MATPNNSEAVDRLLKAWRGEVEAQAVYSILADREKDPQRRGIVREIAAGEARHRQRVEERLRELGQPLPDPSTVGVSTWKRLQARLAPIPRVMASMEAAEDEEIEDRYRRTTGDADTDKVLLAIRSEEQQHARSLRGLQAQIEGGPPPNAVQARLNRILGRERWHQTGAGWISGAIYGANDGLAAVFGIVAGVSGATGGSSFVLTAGVSGAVASALSMATGAFLAERAPDLVGRRAGDDGGGRDRGRRHLCARIASTRARRLTQ